MAGAGGGVPGGGDRSRLERLLAEDVTAWADGGGRIPVARRPIIGPAKVARYLFAWLGRLGEVRDVVLETTPVELNGQPGLVITYGEYVVAATVLELVGGRVAGVRTIAHPEKLAYLARQLSRRPIEAELLATLLSAWRIRPTV
ncbi:hypothetical protein GCM10009765_67860 [Fodinicola feengrottensis]|uniref:SnoaL-like domain-containing protein n=1 Tax=Fodinicola feengrottensis TaxID=435914 RepID=A0ABP4UN78_9ACTN